MSRRKRSGTARVAPAKPSHYSTSYGPEVASVSSTRAVDRLSRDTTDLMVLTGV